VASGLNFEAVDELNDVSQRQEGSDRKAVQGCGEGRVAGAGVGRRLGGRADQYVGLVTVWCGVRTVAEPNKANTVLRWTVMGPCVAIAPQHSSTMFCGAIFVASSLLRDHSEEYYGYTLWSALSCRHF
jgi:hypothetical protein